MKYYLALKVVESESNEQTAERIVELYEVIEKLTSDNSDYAVQPTASPKFPSFEDIIKSLALHEPTNEFYRDGVHDCYNIVKKLGNFA